MPLTIKSIKRNLYKSRVQRDLLDWFLAGLSGDIFTKGSLLLTNPIHARAPKVFTLEESRGVKW